MYSSELKIPRIRIGVLIGKKGLTKKLIEKKTKTKLKVNEEGEVIISSEDSLDIFIATTVIKAIGRGFNPEISLMLLNENYCLEIIEIKDFCGSSRKKFFIVKARVIGTEGKAKRIIEQLTKTEISIYGKTISIIGEIPNVLMAKQAIYKL
ncbi:MAG: KH domain-containing protein [Candidatus Woesearchaeota archaeon]|nr:KH domain-containing protein [Candidatus Woesearchaeota archaeon]